MQIITLPPTSAALHRPHGISVTAWVIDGDTLEIADTQIRLYGIDAN
ncbi:MAG: hypothetical protein M3294_06400 [Pseudomonadota bacterium]|nr:hypothetical protein [Pseudomonadota bacterium]